jgi:hypothetical protein
MMADKRVKQLVRQIESWPAWRLVYGNGHYTAYPPDKAFPPITFASTPSDHRWYENTIHRLRRAGGPI